MSNSKLPERASLEYLKKLAKERLQDLRRADSQAKLATALLMVAQEHGFSSWRALKSELDRRRDTNVSLFFEACARGDVETVRRLLISDRGLARATNPKAPHPGWTGLHAAAKSGHADVVTLLLEHRADPNAREVGDNTYPLHWAAAHGHTDIVQALLDAGGDAHGIGDVHELDVIGWATFYHAPGGDPTQLDDERRKMVSLLLDRGARHHIFSAMSIGDLELIRTLVEQNPGALDRRLSRFEQGQTPLHFAVNRKRYDILDLLIDLGADLEAEDKNGQTALAVAMMRGDQEAMSRLHAAGAQPPQAPAPSHVKASLADMAASIQKGIPMIYVADVARTLDWYKSLGFKEIARYDDDGLVNFGMVSLGKAELMLNMHGKPAPHDVSVWFYTDKIDEIYDRLKSRQLNAAQAALAGAATDDGIAFEQDIENMFYGARQFCIRDLNGYQLYFIQSDEE